jgi:hypothetical protein
VYLAKTNGDISLRLFDRLVTALETTHVMTDVASACLDLCCAHAIFHALFRHRQATITSVDEKKLSVGKQNQKKQP